MSKPEFRHFIDGRFASSLNGSRFEKRCPQTGRVLGCVYEAKREEVDAVVQAARKRHAA